MDQTEWKTRQRAQRSQRAIMVAIEYTKILEFNLTEKQEELERMRIKMYGNRFPQGMDLSLVEDD